jgi:SNF2 family DNA or RNA helicase
MRALIGDEMGDGKTAQAIGAAEAVKASKILVVCPVNAAYVWESEIQAWSSGAEIRHVNNSLDDISDGCRWRIVTYDLLVTRTEIWTIGNEAEEKILQRCRFKNIQIPKGKKYPKQIKLDRRYETSPCYTDKRLTEKWDRIMRRLNGELIKKLHVAKHDLLIIDEAHKVKNRDAKRTDVLNGLTSNVPWMLLLTGTPLRNNEHEAAVLLSYLDETADE